MFRTPLLLSSLAILWLFEDLLVHWELEWPEISQRTISFFPDHKGPGTTQDGAQNSSL